MVNLSLMAAPLIVFDLDGTLVDSRLDLAESANELLASYGAAPLPVDDIVAMVGDGAAKLVARALRAAVSIDPRKADEIPSTKGTLGGSL